MTRSAYVNRELFKGNVRALRKHLGLNSEQLGALLGVKGGAIRNWEAGSASPGEDRLGVLVNIARGRGVAVDLAYLISGVGPEPEWRRTSARPRRLDAAPAEASVTVSGPGVGPRMTGLYFCACESATPCERDDLSPGRMFRCEACGESRVNVLSRDGRTEWIRVAEAAA
jgi:transcriptional regulator with XRE-family HTH domain